MTKRIVSIVALLFFSLCSIAGIGDWRLYPSYQNATQCEIVGEKVYVLASGALYSFNKSDNELYTYDKINTLSDVDITHIKYCNNIEALVIVYSNANIDLLYNDESIYNISDFKNKTLPNKKINDLNIQGSTAYLSTEFGVVELNLDKQEFSNTYNTGYNTYCTYRYKNHLYTGTSTGLLRCDTTLNLLDKNNWEKLNNYPTSSLCEIDDSFYLLISDWGVNNYNADNNRLTQIVKKDGEKYTSLIVSNGQIIALAKDKISIIKSDTEYSVIPVNSTIYSAKWDNNHLWVCKGYSGLVKCEIAGNEIKEVSEPIQPNSPKRNYCEFLKFLDNDKLLVAGGNINYFDITFYDGTLMEYNYNNDSWFNFPEEIIKETTELNYVNICSIDEDPTEEGHYFASSFGYGIYEFRNGEFVKHYNHENSALESVLTSGAYINRYVRVPMVKFDNEGNLWCINTGVKNIVKILKKDGTWETLNYKEIEYLPTMVEPILDSRGWLWITSLQEEPGLFCAKTNNTLFNTGDDVAKTWLHKFTNQDGTSYDIYQVYALREDKNGHMWVGTNTGLFVIDNPENFFNTGVFKQIKIPRNDGTGLADYLMNGVYIKAIAIDGANRKWIGTNDNGIYLISEDGKETIEHFTTQNSPLPSNCIESIAINHNSGEVFIGTNKGIVSYCSDATAPAEKLDDNTIYAYPNPVRADYDGPIMITGLTQECNVKIVDAAGYLINEGTSNGGLYSWDGRNNRGERVVSGVYYVLTYDSNGNEGAVTKILVTR